MKTPATYGLSHIAVAVKDLQKTKVFYQQVFDMEVMYEEEDFIQLTTPGAHDILVFERTRDATGKSGGIAHFRIPAPEREGYWYHEQENPKGRRYDQRPGRICAGFALSVFQRSRWL